MNLRNKTRERKHKTRVEKSFLKKSLKYMKMNFKDSELGDNFKKGRISSVFLSWLIFSYAFNSDLEEGREMKEAC